MASTNTAPGTARLPAPVPPRYPSAVDGFDLDMAFEPADVAAGLERLFRQRSIRWSCVAAAPDHYQFTLTLNDGATAWVDVRPLPAERITYVGFFPRTLLAVHAETGAYLDTLRRDIVLAFMRVTG